MILHVIEFIIPYCMFIYLIFISCMCDMVYCMFDTVYCMFDMVYCMFDMVYCMFDMVYCIFLFTPAVWLTAKCLSYGQMYHLTGATVTAMRPNKTYL